MGYFSMPYLYTERANANFGIKGLRFESHLKGRSWIGFASVSQSVADQTKRFSQIKEISESEYNELKKNAGRQSPDFITSNMDATKPILAQSVATPSQTAEELLMTE